MVFGCCLEISCKKFAFVSSLPTSFCDGPRRAHFANNIPTHPVLDILSMATIPSSMAVPSLSGVIVASCDGLVVRCRGDFVLTLLFALAHVSLRCGGILCSRFWFLSLMITTHHHGQTFSSRNICGMVHHNSGFVAPPIKPLSRSQPVLIVDLTSDLLLYHTILHSSTAFSGAFIFWTFTLWKEGSPFSHCYWSRWSFFDQRMSHANFNLYQTAIVDKSLPRTDRKSVV